MRTRFRTAAVVAFAGLAVVVFVTRSSQSQDKPAGPGGQPPPQDMAAMMQHMVAMASPNENHKQLEPFVGRWKTSMKMWMGPGEPSTSTGESNVEWILGGRYVAEVQKGSFEMPGPDGKSMKLDFEGHGVTGYDNMKKQYSFGWIDNMSTMILTGYGTYDAKSKTLTSYGQADEPMTNMYGRYLKYVHRIESNDKNVFEIHDLAEGGENGRKVLEVTYERVK